MLDWLGVTIRGAQDPAAVCVRETVTAAAAPGPISVLGRPERLGMLDAALVNGTASHALEYDDSLARMQAHPSAVMLPALFALAEARGLSGARVLTALVAGVECGSCLGDAANPSHYAHGWHATATLGALAAAAASARLLGLGDAGMRSALGLASVQAGGLKAAFGTIAKPFQVGRASSAGLLSALLAEGGAEVGGELLAGEGGFLPTYDQSYAPARGRARSHAGYAIRQVLFKQHASCHGTHASLSAVQLLRDRHGVAAEDVAEVRLDVPEQLRTVCGNERPADPSSLRFSLPGLVAAALLGVDTADPAALSDGLLARPDYRRLRDRVVVRYLPGKDPFGGEARVELRLAGRPPLAAEVDVTVPETDLERQGARLRRKFELLVTPVLGVAPTRRLVDAVEAFDSLQDVAEVAALSVCLQ